MTDQLIDRLIRGNLGETDQAQSLLISHAGQRGGLMRLSLMTSLGLAGRGHLRAYHERLAGRPATRACAAIGAHLPKPGRYRNDPHAPRAVAGVGVMANMAILTTDLAGDLPVAAASCLVTRKRLFSRRNRSPFSRQRRRAASECCMLDCP